MTDFFEELGKRITDVAEDLGKRAGDTLEVERLKSKIRSLNRANARNLLEIGEMVYEKFKNGEISDLEYTALCEAVEKRDEEKAEYEEEIQKIKEVV